METEDPYGDLHSVPMESVDVLQRRLDRVSKMLGAETHEISSAVMCGDDRRLFLTMMERPNDIWLSLRNEMEADEYDMLVVSTSIIFASCRVWCPDRTGDQTCLSYYDMLGKGASVALSINEGCTHVLLDTNDKEMLAKVRKELRDIREQNMTMMPVKEVRLVTPAWVKMCMERNEYVFPEYDGVYGPLPEKASTSVFGGGGE